MSDVEEKINNLFIKYAGIDFKDHIELQEKKILGVEIGITPRTLVYIYCKMEEYGLKPPVEAVIAGEFDTFRNICETVEKAN